MKMLENWKENGIELGELGYVFYRLSQPIPSHELGKSPKLSRSPILIFKMTEFASFT